MTLVRNDNIPILPVNIVKIITNFPNVDRSVVIPVDSPTVPNAETTSNKIETKPNFSVIESKNVEIKIRKIDVVKTRKDFFIEMVSTHLPKIVTSSLPFIQLLILSKIMVKVVVFMPPPVPPGDAPTNIKNIVKRRVGRFK